MRQLARALLQAAVMPGAHLDDEVEVFVPRTAALLERGIEAARRVGQQGGDRDHAVRAFAGVLSRAAREQLRGELLVTLAETAPEEEVVDEETAIRFLRTELERATGERRSAGPVATLLRDVAERYEVLALHIRSSKRKERLFDVAAQLRALADEHDQSSPSDMNAHAR